MRAVAMISDQLTLLLSCTTVKWRHFFHFRCPYVFVVTWPW